MQAVPMRTGQSSPCARPTLQHLDLETSIEELLQRVNWQDFPHLETLRLCHHRKRCGHPFRYGSLDLSGLRRLRCLHIVNWSPNSISVTAGCQVHAAWQPYHAQEKHPGPCTTAQGFFATRPWIACQEWLLSPCWTAPGTNLVSFQLDCEYSPVGNQMQAINAVLKRHQRLELLKNTSCHMGSKDEPLMLPSHCSEGVNTLLRVEISTMLGCWLNLDDTSPAQKSIALNTQGSVHIGILDASGDLLWYDWRHYQGCFAISLGGGSSLQRQVAKAMSDGERRWYLVVKSMKPVHPDKKGIAATSGALNKRGKWCIW